jgi:hypothetical protein
MRSECAVIGVILDKQLVLPAGPRVMVSKAVSANAGEGGLRLRRHCFVSALAGGTALALFSRNEIIPGRAR